MDYSHIKLSTDAVRAILEGRKNQIRIPLKKQDMIGGRMTKAGFLVNMNGMSECGGEVIPLPYEVGDIIRVRETWAVLDGEYVYRADDEMPAGWHLTSWRPSIHMPEEAIRLFLCVDDIRVEHLNCITDEDIAHEGIWLDGTFDPETVFAQMWTDSLSNKMNEKYGWDKDPFVWVVTFCVADKNEVPHGG